MRNSWPIGFLSFVQKLLCSSSAFFTSASLPHLRAMSLLFFTFIVRLGASSCRVSQKQVDKWTCLATTGKLKRTIFQSSKIYKAKRNAVGKNNSFIHQASIFKPSKSSPFVAFVLCFFGKGFRNFSWHNAWSVLLVVWVDGPNKRLGGSGPQSLVAW